MAKQQGSDHGQHHDRQRHPDGDAQLAPGDRQLGLEQLDVGVGQLLPTDAQAADRVEEPRLLGLLTHRGLRRRRPWRRGRRTARAVHGLAQVDLASGRTPLLPRCRAAPRWCLRDGGRASG